MSHDLNPSTAMAPAPSPVPNPAPTRRLGSIDAYRGLVMFLMMAEVLRFCAVASAVPGNTIWEFLCHHQSHVEWIGCVLHDMIQPSFLFLVGVALPFSLASRLARGQSQGRMAGHAVWRSLVLPWHRRSSHEPDAPARGVPQSPRWRVGLVCAKDAKFEIFLPG